MCAHARGGGGAGEGERRETYFVWMGKVYADSQVFLHREEKALILVRIRYLISQRTHWVARVARLWISRLCVAVC